jgi:hypothetical protein
MKVAILTASLGGFDRVQQPKEQTVACDWHCFTDEDFPPIVGLSPRLQYRIPKTHGWQMKPGYDFYIWLDGSVTLPREDCVQWYLDQLGDTHDIVIFKHPDRSTARQEADYIERLLQKEHPYITPRYKGGLHEDQMREIEATDYVDDRLYASTMFVYRNSPAVQEMLKEWLYTSVRYFTCDQVALPHLLWKYKLRVKELDMNPFKNPYLTVASRHK